MNIAAALIFAGQKSPVPLPRGRPISEGAAPTPPGTLQRQRVYIGFHVSKSTSGSPRFRAEASLGDPDPASGGHTTPHTPQSTQRPFQRHPSATKDAQKSSPKILLVSFLPPKAPKITFPRPRGLQEEPAECAERLKLKPFFCCNPWVFNLRPLLEILWFSI